MNLIGMLGSFPIRPRRRISFIFFSSLWTRREPCPAVASEHPYLRFLPQNDGRSSVPASAVELREAARNLEAKRDDTRYLDPTVCGLTHIAQESISLASPGCTLVFLRIVHSEIPIQRLPRISLVKSGHSTGYDCERGADKGRGQQRKKGTKQIAFPPATARQPFASADRAASAQWQLKHDPPASPGSRPQNPKNGGDTTVYILRSREEVKSILEKQSPRHGNTARGLGDAPVQPGPLLPACLGRGHKQSQPGSIRASSDRDIVSARVSHGAQACAASETGAKHDRRIKNGRVDVQLGV